MIYLYVSALRLFTLAASVSTYYWYLLVSLALCWTVARAPWNTSGRLDRMVLLEPRKLQRRTAGTVDDIQAELFHIKDCLKLPDWNLTQSCRYKVLYDTTWRSRRQSEYRAQSDRIVSLWHTKISSNWQSPFDNCIASENAMTEESIKCRKIWATCTLNEYRDTIYVILSSWQR